MLSSLKVYGGTAEQLKAYQITTAPPKGQWVSLGDGISFKQVNQIWIYDGEGIRRHIFSFLIKGDVHKFPLINHR